MQIVAVGMSHRTAPVEARERVAFLESRIGSAAALLCQRAGVREAVLLSTCNRTEAYAAVDDPDAGVEAVVAFLCAYHEVGRQDIEPYLYAHRGVQAAQHLFRVAAGLDSMLLGETQILGQVRDAYAAAREAGSAGPVLGALFREAIAAGRRVRQETGIDRGAVSVPGAAVAMARRLVGDLRGRAVLVVGAGEMAELTVRHLASAGCAPIAVCNRTLDNARTLAAMVGGRAVRFDELGGQLAAADILVTSTGAPHPVIEVPLVRQAMHGRGRPLVILDIAVPRDVDPAVAQIDGVHLVNIDDLEGMRAQTHARRSKAVARAEAIAREHAEAFGAWLRSVRVVPLIAALRARADAVLDEEWRRVLPQLASLSARERETVRATLRRVVNRLLHAQIVRLKDVAREHDPEVESAQAAPQLDDAAGP
ncbi:MAG: glutamyl-tRNA reductase [Armatimonadota bacterium]|nr:glutamyl-tRNA reductase [Armatimonadota bacterium]MDR5697716.1 glutamyl-tRNA reductase [Armatimonadota bacterium]